MSQAPEHIDTLVKQCLDGNTRAQMRVYDRYHKAMYNTAYRIVKQKVEAEDIMQEAFLKAFTKIHTFKGKVAFGAWLKRIVINQSIHHYKQLQRERAVPLQEVLYKVEDAPVNLKSGVTESSQAKAVMSAMQGLKDTYRIALTLHLVEGYDYKEIAQITGMSYANSRTTISRAKKKLRTILTLE